MPAIPQLFSSSYFKNIFRLVFFFGKVAGLVFWFRRLMIINIFDELKGVASSLFLLKMLLSLQGLSRA